MLWTNGNSLLQEYTVSGNSGAWLENNKIMVKTVGSRDNYKGFCPIGTINMTPFRTVTMNYTINHSNSSGCQAKIAIAEAGGKTYYSSSTSSTYTIADNGRTYTLSHDISDVKGHAYLYCGLYHWSPATSQIEINSIILYP